MAHSFRDIIGLWPSPDALATELGAKPETVRKWRQRDSIPAGWWIDIVEAAKERGNDLSVAEMAAAARKTPTSEATA